MRIVHAPGDHAPSLEPSFYSREEYDGWKHYVVDDDSSVSMLEAIHAALDEPYDVEHPSPIARGAWIGLVKETTNGNIRLQARSPGPAYGIDDDGRLIMDGSGLAHVTVKQFTRAIDAGHYDTDRREVVLVPPPEVGGNGFIAMSIIEWMATYSAGVLTSHYGGKALDRAELLRHTRIRKLAADWSAQRIESPYQLREFIERSGEWFPGDLAKKLSLSDEAAEKLLRAIGYEKNSNGLMQRRASNLAQRRRWEWIRHEHGHHDDESDSYSYDDGEDGDGWIEKGLDAAIGLLTRLRYRKY